MTPTILRKKENLFYILLFALLFMSPVVAEYVNSQMVGHGSFRWKDVLDVWRIFAIYLAAFIVQSSLSILPPSSFTTPLPHLFLYISSRS